MFERHGDEPEVNCFHFDKFCWTTTCQNKCFPAYLYGEGKNSQQRQLSTLRWHQWLMNICKLPVVTSGGGEGGEGEKGETPSLTLFSFNLAQWQLRTVKPQLNDETFLSNMVFDTQNVWWLNGQTMFNQTSDKVSPSNAFQNHHWRICWHHLNSASDWLLLPTSASLFGRGG